MSERRVAVGFFSFTEVPDGAHRAYNEWHQLDHLPEQYALDGVVHGQRWVATPACAAARAADDGTLGAAQYVTLYLMTEPVGPTLAAFADLAVELRAADRFFADRRSLLAGPWRVAATAAAPRVLLRPSVVPWRPGTGVYVVVEPGDAPPLDPASLCEADGVAGCWTFERDEADHRIAVAWLDGDPEAAAASVAPLLAGRSPTLAGPYARVDPWNWTWFDRP